MADGWQLGSRCLPGATELQSRDPRRRLTPSGSAGEVFATRSRDANARLAVGDREQDGVGDATVIWIGRSLSRTYLAPSAHGSVVIRRARPRRPSAQQPTASRACTRSPVLRATH